MFTKWVKLSEKQKLENQNWVFPGVYAIAYSKNDISEEDFFEKDFSYRKEVVYFGMSHSKNSLKGRLVQFESTINGKSPTHGGAERFLFNLPKEDSSWKENLYVSINPSKDCVADSHEPKDLILKGEISKQEYVCMAEYVKEHKELPRFNDKDRSPKK